MNFYDVAVSIHLPAYGSRTVSGESLHRIFKVMVDGGNYAALKIAKFAKRKFNPKIGKNDDQNKVAPEHRIHLFRRPNSPALRLAADCIAPLLPH